MLAKPGHAGVNATTIELDFRFTGTTASHTGACATDLTTSLAAHRFTPTTQSWQKVLKLSQLHLCFALASLGVLGKDIEDDRGSIDHLDLDHILQRAALGGGQFGVGNDGVGTKLCDELLQLLGLALAEVCGGIGVRQALE